MKNKSDELTSKRGYCSNCGTTTTPLWRRGLDGCYLCNACGLYLKIHKKNRPHEFKSDTFKQRNRTKKEIFYIPQISNFDHYYFEDVKRYGESGWNGVGDLTSCIVNEHTINYNHRPRDILPEVKHNNDLKNDIVSEEDETDAVDALVKFIKMCK